MTRQTLEKWILAKASVFFTMSPVNQEYYMEYVIQQLEKAMAFRDFTRAHNWRMLLIHLNRRIDKRELVINTYA
ncbi:MAG: hypothetical protein DRI61_12735 [Chloroflexi bacterium]|nr:MAG: hypothetical protein DRI61_12735 [Chloroflexota bacterium]